MGFKDMDTEGESNFLKIEAGSFVQFNILTDEPTKMVTHWIQRKPNPCEGTKCHYCDSGNKPRKSWRIKVFDRKTGTSKDFDFGPQIAAQLKNIDSILQENSLNIRDVDIRINRQGAGLEDTEYFVVQVPKKPLPDDATPF